MGLGLRSQKREPFINDLDNIQYRIKKSRVLRFQMALTICRGLSCSLEIGFKFKVALISGSNHQDEIFKSPRPS